MCLFNNFKQCTRVFSFQMISDAQTQLVIPSVGQPWASSLLFSRTDQLEIDFPEGIAC